MEYEIRKGQTALILLTYTVNGEDLANFAPDEIEFTFGGVSYYLSDDSVYYDSEEGYYAVFLSQEATLALPMVASYQLKILKDGQVGLSDIGYERIGGALSDVTLPIEGEVELS